MKGDNLAVQKSFKQILAQKRAHVRQYATVNLIKHNEMRLVVVEYSVGRALKKF